MMAALGLNLTIPAGTATHRSGTAIDLVWGNDATANAILCCGIADFNDHGSDHLPIETTLDLTPRTAVQDTPGYNFSKADWKLMEGLIKEYLPPLDEDATLTVDELEDFTAKIITAIEKAIDKATPLKRPSPFSKRWWTEELIRIRAEVNLIQNRYRRTRCPAYGQEWRKRKEEYERKIKQAKEKTWREFTEQADEKTIWQIKKFLTSKPTQSFIPTLDNDATTNQLKAAMLQATFFPEPPDAETNDIPPITDTSSYPMPVDFDSRITERQIETAIAKLGPHKAPGPDGITNQVLKKNVGVLKGHILKIVQTSLNTGHFPSPFKNTLTIVL